MADPGALQLARARLVAERDDLKAQVLAKAAGRQVMPPTIREMHEMDLRVFEISVQITEIDRLLDE
jgi:hypothetical protein